MKYSGNKDINALVRALIRNGWAYRRGTKHGLLMVPSGRRRVTISGSPSDRRTLLNLLRDVRKALREA